MLKTLRYSVRFLMKSPGFTIMVVLVLGVGIGLNTAIFSLINFVLLKPLPYPNAERLVRVYQPTETISATYVDYPDYQDFRKEQRSCEELCVIQDRSFDLKTEAGAERLDGDFASASFFEVMRTPFVLGRPFTDDEDRPGSPIVVVLNERIWKSRFSGDPASFVGAFRIATSR